MISHSVKPVQVGEQSGEHSSEGMHGEEIRVTGIVQGVGFRPLVWRLATAAGLAGDVSNDGAGVVIRCYGARAEIDSLVEQLRRQPPPLARIDRIARRALAAEAFLTETGAATTQAIRRQHAFSILPSRAGAVHTPVTPDAAVCDACVADTFDPFGRRFRYPFTNCTACGPRLSIVTGVPYDRHNTTMVAFPLCAECAEEYEQPLNRRFHAQPNACYHCGPRAWLERTDGHALCTENLTQLDDVDAACSLLQRGEIVAVKGVGGFHLACDATNDEVVVRLRQRKGRDHKPFALMARDLDMIKAYCTVSIEEEKLLCAAEAPVVVLSVSRDGPPGAAGALSAALAPGQNTLGFMLPYTPLHHLLLKRMNRPIVLTSGNRSEEPQCIDNERVSDQLAGIADYVLMHNRTIANRVDDSVARVVGGVPRLLRRARGYAPAPLPLPPGFEQAPELLAMGGELKNTFCLVKDAQAMLSQHMGDLENAATYGDYQHQLSLYSSLFQHHPQQVVVDCHPEYLSTKLGHSRARETGCSLHAVQHHHAHIAACLAENGWPLDAGPVLGVALDGLGFSARGELWGGEFLQADYCHATRLATFKPVALLGGAQAMRQPWRNTYAHLMAEIGWAQLWENFRELELVDFFRRQPLETFNAMLASGRHASKASSCGRLFDAVAAAMGICREAISYEGQAAVELEAMADITTLESETDGLAYPFTLPNLPGQSGLPYIEPLAMWRALLGDLLLATPVAVMSARFHKGLARAIVATVEKLHAGSGTGVKTVALSGGVLQNRILLEQVTGRLQAEGYRVLTHARVPANDGGLSLGQAAIAAARWLKKVSNISIDND